MAGHKQEQEREDIINSVNSAEASVPTADQPKEQKQAYTCDICGKSFNTERGLHMHRLSAHRIPPPWAKKSGEKSPRKGTGKGREVEQEVTEFEKAEAKIEKEAEKLGEELKQVPDPYKNLYKELRRFKLGQKDAHAVVSYMEGYSLDNVPRLRDALISVGMSQQMIKMFLDKWIRIRGLRLPPEILEDLGLDLESNAFDHSRYSYQWYARRRYYEEPQPVRDPVTLELARTQGKLIEMAFEKQLQQPPPSNSNDQLIQQLFQKIEKLEEKNKELEKKVEEKEREILRREIESLKQEIRELKNQNRVMSEIEFKDRRWQDFSQKIDRVLDWIEAMGTRYRRPPEYEEEVEASKLPSEIEEEFEELGLVEEE